MNLSPEERAIGKENFNTVVELTRREFLERSAAAAAVTGIGLGGFYFGYEKLRGDPVRVGMIGTGDEGGVLIGAHTPDYLNIVAISDIRPYNVHRAFHGDQSSESIRAVRPGLMSKYGWTEDKAKKNIKVYADYQDLLKDDNIEAVIIALPLFLHDKVAIEAMNNGKHVLTEKLMAHSVHQCKDMGRVAAQKNLLLATGHQRHYSILYDNAVDTIKRKLIGDIHFIRAQWHRGNLPGKDSWAPTLPNEKMEKDLAKVLADLSALDADMSKDVETFTKLLSVTKELESAKASRIDTLEKRRDTLQLQLLDKDVDAAKHGYEGKTLTGGEKPYVCSPLEELIRWRLWNRTGGGLMAELGSHQLDAAGIFCTAMRTDGQKALPLSVTAVGGRYIFPLDRDCDDHVYCTYEYPGPDYAKDPNKKIVVTYSSINGNGFGGYGETVMGTKGTLIVDREQEVMLFKDAATTTSVTVLKEKGGGVTLDTTASGGPAAAAKKSLDAGPPSRGYTEEMEHFAWCIRNHDGEHNKPKCHPKVAMADAIIALTTNIAMREGRRIEFKKEWFDIESDETPEGIAPSVKM